ncbi:cytochrome P450 [Thozetella sp. PMI_491]|nr:cytochrome P450 [Thozetella sp. PMI_491]
MFSIAQRLGSPIAQLLLTSFAANPIILVDDPREVEDILVRRNREFDRSALTTQFFDTLLPRSTLAQFTTPELKAQKRLWSEVMNVDFLRRVVAPNIRTSAMEIVDLWRLKSSQAPDGQFEVLHDFGHAALDIIWIAVLGSKLGIVRRDIEALRGDAREKSPDELQAAATGVVLQEAVEYINSTVEKGMSSLWPKAAFWWLQSRAEFRRVKRTADLEVQRLIVAACHRFERLSVGSHTGNGDGAELDTCAMDLVLRREMMAAKKAGIVVPDAAKDPAVLQELLLLLIAGFESTANTLAWFVKITAANQASQNTLRLALQSAFAGSSSPSAAEILDADIPYLDGFIEEVVRLSATAGIIGRQATVDTEILGCRVPAGSNILLNTRLTQSQGAVPERIRSQSSQVAQEKRARGGLDGESGRDLEEFEPRRWLTKDMRGKEVFDPNSLPVLIFGGGLRGCFGKRLAMQELRIMIVLLVLNFEFLPLPESLTSMEGIEKLFRRPKISHVRLRSLSTDERRV